MGVTARASSVPEAYGVAAQSLRAQSQRLGVALDLGKGRCKAVEHVVGPSAKTEHVFSCAWETPCATLSVGGQGQRPDTFAFEAHERKPDCSAERLTPWEHAFIAAFLECDSASATAASVERLSREPTPLSESATESSKAQLEHSDVLPICHAMHGLRRVYRVNGRGYRDIYLSRITPN